MEERTVTAEDLQNRLKKFCSSLVVITADDGKAVDIEYLFSDKSYRVLYDFRVHKYGRAWCELTPPQLIQVRITIADYLKAIGLQKYANDFEVDQNLEPTIKMLGKLKHCKEHENGQKN